MIGTLLERLFIAVSADMSDLTGEMDRAANDVKRQTANISRRFLKMGETMARVGKTMSVAVTVPLLAIGKNAVSTASDIQEMQAKFRTVFGSLSDDVSDWAATTGKAVNRSRFDLMKYAAALQDTFVPLKFSRTEAAKMSKQVAQLGVDMASFYNASEPEVLEALQSALVGNHETVRKFGVIITQATLNAELMREGIQGGTKAATEQEKVVARLNLILQGTTDAQGDAARTAGSYANQVRGLKAAMTDVQNTIGTALLPVMTDLVGVLTQASQWFADLDPGIQNIIIHTGELAAVLGPVLVLLPQIAAGIGVVAGAFVALDAVLIANPIGATIVGVLGLAAAIWTLRDALKDLPKKFKDAFAASQSFRDDIATGHYVKPGESLAESYLRTAEDRRKEAEKVQADIERLQAQISSRSSPGAKALLVPTDHPGVIEGQIQGLQKRLDALLKAEKDLRDKAAAATKAVTDDTSDQIDEVLHKPITSLKDLEDAIKRLGDQGSKDVQPLIDALEALYKKLQDGPTMDTSALEQQIAALKKQLADLKRDTDDVTEQVSERARSISGVINQHLHRAFETGKLDFKAMMEDILKTAWLEPAMKRFSDALGGLFDQMFSALDKQVASGLGSLFGGGGKGGSGFWSGVGDFFGSLFGGGRAVGGVVPPWKSFLAGERGAELIEQDGPSGARRIATAGRTAAMGGGHIHVTVSGARGNAEIETMVRQGVASGLARYDKVVGSRVDNNVVRMG